MSECNVLTGRAVLTPGTRLVLANYLAIDLHGRAELSVVALDSFYLECHRPHQPSQPPVSM